MSLLLRKILQEHLAYLFLQEEYDITEDRIKIVHKNEMTL